MENKTIGILADFDLTLTEEYQQIPLIQKHLEKYKNYYNKPDILKKFRKYDPDFIFKEPIDFFKVLQIKRKMIISKNNNARIQNGVTWLQQLINDCETGRPLENITIKDMFEVSKNIKMTPGSLECFNELKNIWSKKGINIKIYIVSVGLKTLIEAAIESYLKNNNIKNNPIDGIFSGEIVEIFDDNNKKKLKIISIIEDYSKTEIAYEVAKGGKSNRDKKVSNYDIPFNQFIILGDGFSDIPMFRFFKRKGSKCIIVYKKSCQKSFEKIMPNAFQNVDYILERNYIPCNNNPTWIYINKAINDIININSSKYTHSECSIHNYKWRKKISESEKKEIENFIINSEYHNFGYNLTYVLPSSK